MRFQLMQMCVLPSLAEYYDLFRVAKLKYGVLPTQIRYRISIPLLKKFKVPHQHIEIRSTNLQVHTIETTLSGTKP